MEYECEQSICRRNCLTVGESYRLMFDQIRIALSVFFLTRDSDYQVVSTSLETSLAR